MNNLDLAESMQQERGIYSPWIQEQPKGCGLDDMRGSRKPGHWNVTTAKSKVPQWKSPAQLGIPHRCGINSTLLLNRYGLDIIGPRARPLGEACWHEKMNPSPSASEILTCREKRKGVRGRRKSLRCGG